MIMNDFTFNTFTFVLYISSRLNSPQHTYYISRLKYKLP